MTRPIFHLCQIVGAALSAALVAACSPLHGGSAVAASPDVQHAWVQRSAAQGWMLRAVTTGRQCPVAQWSGGAAPMATRAEPASIASTRTPGTSDAKATNMPVRSCELPLPANARDLRVGPIALPSPPQDIRRIVLIGDTGCRMKGSEDFFQNCNDSQAWPFAQVAASAAEKHPDLVIHVGDLHYRESPCPADRPGCANSPWGYGYDVWEADVFKPAHPLLQAAPWLLVRGNHESCARAGVGWQRFLDPQGWSVDRSCEDGQPGTEGDFTEPYAVPLTDDTQLIVFDSSFVLGRAYQVDDPVFKRYAHQMEQVRHLSEAKPHNFFLNHHPVLGFAGGKKGKLYPGNAGLQSVMTTQNPVRLFPRKVDMVISGHVHLFEGLDFASDHPLALIMGNAGSAMDTPLDKAAVMAAQPAPGAIVRTYVSQSGYGFATLDRNDKGWLLTEWNVAGKALLSCQLVASQMTCN